MAVNVTTVLFAITKNWLTITVSGQFTAGLRDKLFSHLKKLPIDYFDKNQAGRVMTRVNQDTSELQDLFNQMTTFALNLMMVVGIGIALFTMAPSLGLYVLIPTPFVMAAAYYYYRYMQPHFRRFWIARWRLNAMLNTSPAFASSRRSPRKSKRRSVTTAATRRCSTANCRSTWPGASSFR